MTLAARIDQLDTIDRHRVEAFVRRIERRNERAQRGLRGPETAQISITAGLHDRIRARAKVEGVRMSKLVDRIVQAAMDARTIADLNHAIDVGPDLHERITAMSRTHRRGRTLLSARAILDEAINRAIDAAEAVP